MTRATRFILLRGFVAAGMWARSFRVVGKCDVERLGSLGFYSPFLQPVLGYSYFDLQFL
jgi:hypothetical protein